MQTRKVVRIVDASVTQGRHIVWLDCHHKISVTQAQATAEPRLLREASRTESLDCPFCPDLPPDGEQSTKSARQLYKEAGEP